MRALSQEAMHRRSRCERRPSLVAFKAVLRGHFDWSDRTTPHGSPEPELLLHLYARLDKPSFPVLIPRSQSPRNPHHHQ